MRIRERPSLRQTVEVVDPAGQRSYWTEDAPNPADALQDLSYSSVAPGGFATLDCKLMRKIAVVYGDMAPYATCRVRNASGGIDWEGRLERAARTSGREVTASPSAVGFQAALEDDKSVMRLYADHDLSRWVEPSATRKAGLAAAWFLGRSLAVESDSGGLPGISMTITGQFDDTHSEAVYDAHGQAIGLLHVNDVTRLGLVADGSLSATPRGWTTDTGAGEELGSDYKSSSSISYFPSAGQTLVVLNWYWTGAGPAGADGVEYGFRYRGVGIYGMGLSLRGVAPWEGVYASDVMDDMIGNGFPTWQRKITPTDYVITQAAYLEPTTRAEIIKDVNRFHVYDWFVWEGPLFEYRPRSEPGRRWRSQVGPAQLEETGQAADKMWRSVFVSWKDPDGSTRTAGPPDSGAQTVDSSLTNGDLDIPADRVYHLALDIAVSGAAIQAGQRVLYEANQVDRSGKAIQVGYVEDADTGILEPASHMRAGDAISFTDASDTSFRRISNVSWDRPSRTANLDLDSPAETLQAVVERLNADVAGLVA